MNFIYITLLHPSSGFVLVHTCKIVLHFFLLKLCAANILKHLLAHFTDFSVCSKQTLLVEVELNSVLVSTK